MAPVADNGGRRDLAFIITCCLSYKHENLASSAPCSLSLSSLLSVFARLVDLPTWHSFHRPFMDCHLRPRQESDLDSSGPTVSEFVATLHASRSQGLVQPFAAAADTLSLPACSCHLSQPSLPTCYLLLFWFLPFVSPTFSRWLPYLFPLLRCAFAPLLVSLRLFTLMYHCLLLPPIGCPVSLFHLFLRFCPGLRVAQCHFGRPGPLVPASLRL